ncbi:trifunctional hydroxymethylpyrimidine kinase/phosphomethylpyrimidine kinase/thiaminase [Diaporthe eres]|uniref:Trifunctional hydroxymethylpyrimidine kinase/phosphomethylpyrimidine kinase/thiaminase n=1 Tax=Diaporthe eres TaxID=83184 RepID=A0ABR1PHC6_DIAER
MVQGRLLVIAGSDCSGGAGLEADQKVIAAHGCYAMTATTALTAQNTLGVYDIHPVPPAFLRKQIDACFDDIGVDVVKTGMLASTETIAAVAEALERRDFGGSLVVDPVMVATTGAELLPSEALRELRGRLLPRATVLTPNIPEARLLLADAGLGAALPADALAGAADLEAAGRALLSLGPEWVLVKGGHAPLRRGDYAAARTDAEREVVVDVLCGKGACVRIETDFQTSRNTHGTGCSLASAIASNLAKGMPVPQAVKAACRGHFVEWMLERPDVAPVWHRFINHPFVLAMGNGTLPLESFKGYLVQDYLYLIQFARANALAGYKAKNMRDIAAAAAIVGHIDRETALHLTYCEGFGVSREEMEATEEKQACTAYTRYVLDIGQSQDWLGLQVALAPCLLGYGALAKMLHGDPKSVREGNHYWNWIENYVADDYVQAVKTGSELLERNAVLQSPSRVEEIVKIFIHATKMEIGFWEMFPHGQK